MAAKSSKRDTTAVAAKVARVKAAIKAEGLKLSDFLALARRGSVCPESCEEGCSSSGCQEACRSHNK